MCGWVDPSSVAIQSPPCHRRPVLSIQTKFSGTAARQLNDVSRRLRSQAKKLAMAAGKLIRTNIATEVERFAENPTGALADSFVVLVGPSKEGEQPKAQVTIESTKAYAGIHEHGGTIRPKRARALTIPLTPMARRLPARLWPKGKLFRLKGTSVLASKWGRGVRPQFVLKRSVYIKPKRYVTKALKRSQAQLRNLMGIHIRSTLGRVSR